MPAFPPPDVRPAAAAMARYPGWWGIAGGWAADLHLGSETRHHDDVEVTILRRDLDLARAVFDAAWSYVQPHPAGLEDAGSVHPWEGSPPTLPVHQVSADLDTIRLDFLLSEASGGEWRYRRDQRVARELGATLCRRHGPPHLAPEIVLLFKAKHRRPKDEHDLRLLLPVLSPGQRSWLGDALTTVEPGNPWLQQVMSGV